MSVDKVPPRRLGRGLEALLGAAAHVGPDTGAPLRQIPLAEIRPNPFQPRKNFNAEDIAELQASLASSGLLQPITVRAIDGREGYELIAGERRLRAATALGWTEIAAIVKEMDNRTALTLALVENLQRADLNPIEEAEGYQRLITEFSLTQQDVARVVGKDRSTVTNLLRILGLPRQVQQLVREGKLSLGHARALLGCRTERHMGLLAMNTVHNSLSVRELERRVSGHYPPKPAGEPRPTKSKPGAALSPELRAIQDRMRAYLQTDVRVELSGPESGTIGIRFYSIDDLDRVLELVLKHGPMQRETP
ncbi:MAG TPA: ParB/RepB/Spo0J family partition protein [Gemmatimonadaceae bacterium]|jgi:ParB family chromosome partitioning protein|nr:ParB/RepB/Spo0J family partition protein [Gemmatimonadaceae bacterium]